MRIFPEKKLAVGGADTSSMKTYLRPLIHAAAAFTLCALAFSCGPQSYAEHGAVDLVTPGDTRVTWDGDMATATVPEGLTAPSELSGAPAVVFLNFEGPTISPGGWAQDNAQANTSFIVPTATAIPAFDATPWSEDRDATIQAIVDGVKEDFSSFPVTFTTTRPTSGNYTMIVIGGQPGLIGQSSGRAGVAPRDGDNWNAHDVGFVFSENCADFGLDPRGVAYIISHEIAHTVGLQHIDPSWDIMNAYAGDGVRHWGVGAITDASGGEQNDLLALAAAFQDQPTGNVAFDVLKVSVRGSYVPLVGDFDGDGKTDLFWYGPGRTADSVWYGRADRQFTILSQPVNGRYLPVVGDFNGDHITDIFWYGIGTAADNVWFGHSTRFFDTHSWPLGGNMLPVTGDFNGDGTTDIFWYGSGTFANKLWLTSTAGTVTSTTVAMGGNYRPFAGDFNGDGRGDILWYGAQGGANNLIWLGQTDGTFITKDLGPSSPLEPTVADYNGDGWSDILWYSNTTDLNAVDFFTGDAEFVHSPTNVDGPYEPFTGDFDGDGKKDIFWYGGGVGADFVWRGNSNSTFQQVDVSFPGVFVPLVGDFDGNGADDVFFYGPGKSRDLLAFGVKAVAPPTPPPAP